MLMLMTVACFFTEKMKEAEEEDKVSWSSLLSACFRLELTACLLPTYDFDLFSLKYHRREEPI